MTIMFNFVKRSMINRNVLVQLRRDCFPWYSAKARALVSPSDRYKRPWQLHAGVEQALLT